MKKLLFVLLVLALCLLCLTASADGLARIIRPADGAVVAPGSIPLWLSFTYTGGSATELASTLMPTMIIITDEEGNVIDTKAVRKLGTISFTDEGAYFTTLTIDTEGTYVIGVSTPGAPEDWDFALITVSGEAGSPTDPGTDPVQPEPETPGRKWSTNNPGYSIRMEQDEYTVDLAEDNRIMMRFTLKDTSGRNSFDPCFADWISESARNIIRFKAIGENELVDHGTYRSVDDGWILYRALDVGDVDFYYYVLDDAYYDEHIVKIHVIDSAGEGAQTKQLFLSDDLTVIEAEAFAGDTSFDVVFVPDGCTSIGSRAFANCTFMDSIYIPESVTFIAEDAFAGVNSLRIYAKSGSYAEQYAENRFRFTPY